MKRRDFIRTAGLGALSLFVPGQSWAAAPGSLYGALGPQRPDNYLILVHLAGGNDGLNTVVPFRSDAYQAARPKLALNRHNTLPLSSELRLNPALGGLKHLYDEGHLTIINGVGHGEPSKSHFTSEDLWHSGGTSSRGEKTGWLGRYLNTAGQEFSNLHAVEFARQQSMIFQGERMSGFTVDPAPGALTYTPQEKHLRQHRSPSALAGFLRGAVRESYTGYRQLAGLKLNAFSCSDYPNSPLRRGLMQTVNLIGNDIDTHLFHLRLPGFDTHTKQLNRQNALLKTLGDSMRLLVDDLRKIEKFDRTTIVIYSEFGRTSAENASGGTDHGDLNTVFVISEQPARPGILTDQVVSDGMQVPAVYTDFRQIYAELLERWLFTDSLPILGRAYTKLNFL